MQENITPAQIQQLATSYRTSTRTIYRHLHRIRANLPVERHTGGMPRLITWRMEQAMKELLDQMLWFYQDEIADFLYEVLVLK